MIFIGLDLLSGLFLIPDSFNSFRHQIQVDCSDWTQYGGNIPVMAQYSGLPTETNQLNNGSRLVLKVDGNVSCP